MDNAVELGNRRVLHPGKLRWLRALGWLIALFVLVMGTFILVANGVIYAGIALGLGDGKPLPELRLAATIVAATASLGVYAGAVRLGENRRVAELSLRALPAELAIGLAVGAVLMALAVGALWALDFADVGARPVTRVIRALELSVQSGVLEETLFRLVMFRLLWRGFGIWAALAVSAFLFGALHLNNPNASWFAAICIALEAGILLAAFYVLTGRGWMPIGVHAGWNFTQGWVFGAAVSGTDGFAGGPLATVPDPADAAILSGGGFGPEASLPGLVICTAAGLLVLWRARQRGRFAPAPDAVETPPEAEPAAAV